MNSFINLADMATLGLSHLFVTASLHDQLARKIRAAGLDADFSAAAWVAKWLFLGNVGFVLAYVACPGLCFAKILRSIEEHLRTLESGLVTPLPQIAAKPASAAAPAPGAPHLQSRETPHVKRVRCRRCGTMILASTAEKTGGLCIPCRRSGSR